MNVLGFLAGAFVGVGGIYLYVTNKKVSAPKTKGSADDVVRYFLDNGFTINQSGGVAGNIQAESNFNSLAKGDAGTAFGIAQWRGDRLQKLIAFAEANNYNYEDFNTQLAFIIYELQNYEKRALQKLLEANTLETATVNFATYYERPQASTIPKRVVYSKEIMKQYV